jgi:hypothetical protein
MRVQENTRPLDKRREQGDIRDDRKGMLMEGDRSCFPAVESTADSRGDQATVLYEAQVELADGPLDQGFSDPSSRDHAIAILISSRR